MHIYMIPERASYVAITDTEAVRAFSYLSETEGIIPAIESAHALAYAMKVAPKCQRRKSLSSICLDVEIKM